LKKNEKSKKRKSKSEKRQNMKAGSAAKAEKDIKSISRKKQKKKKRKTKNIKRQLEKNELEQHKKAKLKKYVKLAGNALSALSVIFVLAAFCRTDFDWSAVKDWRSFACICVLGIALKTFTVYVSGSAWYLWLEFFSGERCGRIKRTERIKALCVYAKANIGKYLPGNVMHYVERNLFAKDLDLTQKQIAAASVTEVATLVLAAFFIGVVMSYSSLLEALAVIGRQRNIRLLSAALAGACILGAAAFVFVVWYIRHKKQKQISGSPAKTLHLEKSRFVSFVKVFSRAFAAYAAVLLILGFIYVLIYWYWAGMPSWEQAAQMMAAYVTAWVLGFIVPGAPGGIGVRELVLTLLLSQAVGGEQAAALGILHRVITVIGDFAAYVARGCFRVENV